MAIAIVWISENPISDVQREALKTWRWGNEKAPIEHRQIQFEDLVRLLRKDCVMCDGKYIMLDAGVITVELLDRVFSDCPDRKPGDIRTIATVTDLGKYLVLDILSSREFLCTGNRKILTPVEVVELISRH